MRTPNALILLVTALAAMCVYAVSAGPLDPPAGPVAPTEKPLRDVEPRTVIRQADIPLVITEPGSYLLAERITPTGTGQTAITIDASRVTLDLGGALIDGAATRPNTFAVGVQIEADARGVVVRNGAIDGADAGVRAASRSTVTLEDLRVSNTTGDGIRVFDDSVVTRCDVSGSGGRGVWAGDRCRITDTYASQNGADGFEIGDDAVVERCRSTGNAEFGLIVGSGAVLRDCVVAENTGELAGAIRFGADATIIGCTARNNTGIGFGGLDPGASTLEHCVSSGNTGSGFSVRNGSSVRACVARNNGAAGFFADRGATLRDCTAQNNGGVGFTLIEGATARDCIARENGSDGFGVGAHSIVIGCIARENTRYGFHLNQVSEGAMLRDCNSADNGDHGYFLVGDGWDVSGCVASGNAGNGFRTDTQSSRGKLVRCHTYDDNYNVFAGTSNFIGTINQSATLANDPWINTAW